LTCAVFPEDGSSMSISTYPSNAYRKVENKDTGNLLSFFHSYVSLIYMMTFSALPIDMSHMNYCLKIKYKSIFFLRFFFWNFISTVWAWNNLWVEIWVMFWLFYWAPYKTFLKCLWSNITGSTIPLNENVYLCVPI